MRETITEAIEKEITRGNCNTCSQNERGICVITEEKIGSGDEYCETEPVPSLLKRFLRFIKTLIQ